jgi:acyl-CoA thioesterase-1
LQKNMSVYGVLVALVYCLTACSSPSEEASAPLVEKTGEQQPPQSGEEKQAETLILAFGDSLYAGYGVKPNESLPAKLEAALKTKGYDVRVENAGVSGDTTAAGLQRLAFVLDGLSRTPDLVLLGLGGNDMLRGIQPEQTRENMEQMMAELDRRGIKVALTGMLAARNLGPDYVRDFESLYPDLAKQYDAALYPFILEGVVQNADLMLPDGVHPNARGIDRIVDALLPVVTSALPKQD